MKIGIITFHWATNYGAILQAFALQTYLKNMGHDVYIINYKPKQYRKNIIDCFSTRKFWLYLSNLKEYFKEQKLNIFRKSFLNETLLYESLDELKSNAPNFEAYICGSDQVWNPSFTIRGEGKPTSSYFLDFGDDQVKRIAYAVSFGCEKYPEEASTIAKKYIHNFNAISVRENSGLNIVTKLGFLNPIKLPDPTLLLQRDEYFFVNTGNVSTEKKVFVYILRKEDKELRNIKTYLGKKFKLDNADKLVNPYTVEEWVSAISNASIVLTNSFHGMVFSLIFHVPFIVLLPNEGWAAGMNDRFKTLLSYLKLEHRILYTYDIDKLGQLIDEQINWQNIDQRLAELRSESANFFNTSLN